MKKYKCSICAYIYNPLKGDPESAIAPNTSFIDLPEDWTCPVCRVDKSSFVEIDESNENSNLHARKDEQIAPKNDTRIEEENDINDYDKTNS